MSNLRVSDRQVNWQKRRNQHVAGSNPGAPRQLLTCQTDRETDRNRSGKIRHLLTDAGAASPDRRPSGKGTEKEGRGRVYLRDEKVVGQTGQTEPHTGSHLPNQRWFRGNFHQSSWRKKTRNEWTGKLMMGWLDKEQVWAGREAWWNWAVQAALAELLLQRGCSASQDIRLRKHRVM